ncbi:hypothetical protein [Bradyrhizobium sp. 6(2017)]|uniref:hypothetical protein n=2 Tax=unclassified Bradyrhizobium TaxID=2631580 RepID=UPI0013E198DB|nr:hypothetical protein [Bradyrhizobium sp. 6(2017)]QIG93196.1 hypothetical protein G6P99_12300 [Bradyrhizobium sp. 6(2017)]
MPINQLLKDCERTPEEIERLNKAFDHALHLLGVLDRDDPLCRMVARDVIDICAAGTNDPRKIAKIAVERMGLR